MVSRAGAIEEFAVVFRPSSEDLVVVLKKHAVGIFYGADSVANWTADFLYTLIKSFDPPSVCTKLYFSGVVYLPGILHLSRNVPNLGLKLFPF